MLEICVFCCDSKNPSTTLSFAFWFNFWSPLISPCYSKIYIFFKPGQQVLLYLFFYKLGTSPWTAANRRQTSPGSKLQPKWVCLGPAAIFSWPLLNYKCVYCTVKRISMAALPAAGLATVCSAQRGEGSTAGQNLCFIRSAPCRFAPVKSISPTKPSFFNTEPQKCVFKRGGEDKYELLQKHGYKQSKYSRVRDVISVNCGFFKPRWVLLTVNHRSSSLSGYGLESHWQITRHLATILNWKTLMYCIKKIKHFVSWCRLR